MRTAKVLLIIWLAALVGTVAAAPVPRAGDETHAPQPAPTSCPVVTVNCVDTADYGRPFTFTANISGGDAAVTPTFNWSVPGFRILSGEGTASITVECPAQTARAALTKAVQTAS